MSHAADYDALGSACFDRMLAAEYRAGHGRLHEVWRHEAANMRERALRWWEEAARAEKARIAA